MRVFYFEFSKEGHLCSTDKHFFNYKNRIKQLHKTIKKNGKSKHMIMSHNNKSTQTETFNGELHLAIKKQINISR